MSQPERQKTEIADEVKERKKKYWQTTIHERRQNMTQEASKNLKAPRKEHSGKTKTVLN